MKILMKLMFFFISLFLIHGFYCQSDEKIKLSNFVKFNEDKSILKPFMHSISLSASFNRNPIIIGSPSTLLLSNQAPSFTFRKPFNSFFINYQYNLLYNFFVEANFTYKTLYHGFRANDFIIFQGYRSIFFTGVSVLSFDLGSGLRITTFNNKIRLFDLHAGLNIGIATEKVGTQIPYTSNISYIDFSGNAGVVNINSNYLVTNRANIGLYLGFSKDFKLSENLYFHARFNSYFGKRRRITSDTFEYSIPALGISNIAYGNSTIKGQTYTIGLKWLFAK